MQIRLVHLEDAKCTLHLAPSKLSRGTTGMFLHAAPKNLGFCYLMRGTLY